MHLQSLILLPTICPVRVGATHIQAVVSSGMELLPQLCTFQNYASTMLCVYLKLPSFLGIFKEMSIHLCISTRYFVNCLSHLLGKKTTHKLKYHCRQKLLQITFYVQGLIKSTNGLQRGIIISLWQKLQKRVFLLCQIIRIFSVFSTHLSFSSAPFRNRGKSQLTIVTKISLASLRILSVCLAKDHGSPPHSTPALSMKTCCLKFWKEGKQQEGSLRWHGTALGNTQIALLLTVSLSYEKII